MNKEVKQFPCKYAGEENPWCDLWVMRTVKTNPPGGYCCFGCKVERQRKADKTRHKKKNDLL